LVFSVITKPPGNPFPLEFALMSMQPCPKTGDVRADVCPIPPALFPETTINFTCIAPAGTGMPSKVNEQKHQPERLFNLPTSFIEYCSLEWIEKLAIWVATTTA
jgi:hypothetical protein